METDDIAFELRLRFKVYCMASKEKKVGQIEEDPSDLYHRSMYLHEIGALSDQWFGLRSSAGRRSQRNI